MRPGRTCLQVAPGDIGALAAAIADICADNDLAAGLGEAGRARFNEHFTREAMIGRLLAWYRRLAADTNGGAS